MADAVAARFSCSGCGKAYGWKLELAGRKVKCKCGTVMVVPATPPQPEENGIFDLAPEEAPAKPAARPRQTIHHSSGGSIMGATAMGLTALPNLPARPIAKKPAAKSGSPKPASHGGHTIEYSSGPTARERERASLSNTVEMTRDVYMPTAIIVIGLLAFVACIMLKHRGAAGDLAMISLGLGVVAVVKAAMLLGFAFLIAGPVGVSFGGIWTAVLKLAAITIFCDAVIAWVEFGLQEMGGQPGRRFNRFVSLPVSLGVYWALLVYLFSMDAGDSWLVVILLSVFNFIFKIVLTILLFSMIG